MLESVEARAPSRHPLTEAPLALVIADGDALLALRRGAPGPLPLVPPLHLSDHDLYLVVPDDVGLDLADTMRQGDRGGLRAALADSLVVRGEVGRANGRGVLEVAEHWSPLA